MTWKLVCTKQAQEDSKKLASMGLKPKVQELLSLIAEVPTVNRLQLRSLWGLTHVKIIASIDWYIRCWRKITWESSSALESLRIIHNWRLSRCELDVGKAKRQGNLTQVAPFLVAVYLTGEKTISLQLS